MAIYLGVIIVLLALLLWGEPVWRFLKVKVTVWHFRRTLTGFAAQRQSTLMRWPHDPGELTRQFMQARENYDGDDPELLKIALFSRIMHAIGDGRAPQKKEVKRLMKLGGLKTVNPEGLALFPDAAYELDHTTTRRVFFQKNLVLAGYKDYDREIESILVQVLERKRLFPEEVKLLRRTCCFFAKGEWERWRGKYHGSPGFPYPDVRYRTRAMVHGKHICLSFDEKFNLVVATQDRENRKEEEPFYEVIWELPGARQPALYGS